MGKFDNAYAEPVGGAKKRLTLDDIRAMDKEMLLPKDVSAFLGCNSFSINCQAKDDPYMLGFPVSVMGSRVYIPKAGFVAWAEGRFAERYVAEINAAAVTAMEADTE